MSTRGSFARSALACVASLVALASATPAAQADEEADGVYGRFDGDLDFRVGAGATITPSGTGLSAFVSALYLSSAGFYAHYTDALGAAGSPVDRSIAAGLVVEPLFLGRFATNLERGPARLDLLLDSFALGLGAFWEQPRGAAFVAEPGMEVSVGLGLPLFAHATGPVLGVRGALRLRPRVVSGAAPFELDPQGGLLSVTLAWRHVLPVHLVDVADRPAR